MPKLNFDEIKDHNCSSCDKAQQRMPDSSKEMPEEFKAKYPMQHLYADIGMISDEEACGGLRNIVCFREYKGKLRGYYPVDTLADVPKMLNLFLREHFHQVTDIRAMEKGLLIIKPDGDLGAFGKEFERVAQSFGYKVDPSLPETPSMNQSEWSVNEVKRRATALIEHNCLPKQYFPLVLHYISQMACLSPKLRT